MIQQYFKVLNVVEAPMEITDLIFCLEIELHGNHLFILST